MSKDTIVNQLQAIKQDKQVISQYMMKLANKYTNQT
jgi:hypothetical protein